MIRNFILFNTHKAKFIFLLVALFAGSLSAFLFRAETSDISPRKLTLCRLLQNPEAYHDKIVSVEGDGVSVSGAIFISDENCSASEKSVAVWLEEKYKPADEAGKLFEESETEKYKARVLVSGRFDAHATPGCFAPPSAITATQVELKSPVVTEQIEKYEAPVSRQDID